MEKMKWTRPLVLGMEQSKVERGKEAVRVMERAAEKNMHVYTLARHEEEEETRSVPASSPRPLSLLLMPVSVSPPVHFNFCFRSQGSSGTTVQMTLPLDCGHGRYKQKISCECLQRGQQCVQGSFSLLSEE